MRLSESSIEQRIELRASLAPMDKSSRRKWEVSLKKSAVLKPSMTSARFRLGKVRNFPLATRQMSKKSEVLPDSFSRCGTQLLHIQKCFFQTVTNLFLAKTIILNCYNLKKIEAFYFMSLAHAYNALIKTIFSYICCLRSPGNDIFWPFLRENNIF